MAEPLKTFFSDALVRRLAADIQLVEPSFPSASSNQSSDRHNGVATPLLEFQVRPASRSDRV